MSRAVGSPARFATSFFADTLFSGQVNFLTTGSFETPKELFSSDSLAHGIAYVRLGAPVGSNGDWAVRGAVTQADISSWVLAGFRMRLVRPRSTRTTWAGHTAHNGTTAVTC